MKLLNLVICVICCVSLFVPLTGGVVQGDEVDFSHEVVPLLKQQCGKCHSGSQKKGGFSINLRETLLSGGESGVAVVPGKGTSGELYARITTDDNDLRMPPEGDRLTDAQIRVLMKWIDEGAKWEPGFTFGPRLYEPPLRPRQPELPAAREGRIHPLDRILDADLTRRQSELPLPVDDAAFLRRASLDLIGLLPTPEEREAFLADPSPDKRVRLVEQLLARDVDYAEHWLTFWNDLLRNDYAGTGFITGGRKQISKWLYESLINNKPYDQFVRELISPPSVESAGFADGIRWRGEVSAGQTVEIQFAQSVGQAFLGINLKCASCHDSFVDRWTLDDAYGLAAVYAQRPLELHRCDKPIGKQARAAWLFDELGQVDADASQPERLRQLAALMTHRENGRFSRTIVNRLWHRLMGRGIVHPTDAMQSPPWNADLLDYLAEDLVRHHYDLKQTLRLIATSEAYQARSERVTDDVETQGYHYAGPRTKRMTAEQFMDSIWQITGAAPKKFDAPVIRGKSDPKVADDRPVAASWIWNRADAAGAAAGETIVFRQEWELSAIPAQTTAVISCDNEYTLFVNGKKLIAGTNWEVPDLVSVTNLKTGKNEVVIIARNGGAGPNPAGLFFEARWSDGDGKQSSLLSDDSWQWTTQQPDRSGKFKNPPKDWKPAAKVQGAQVWMNRLQGELASLLSRGASASGQMVRASLLKSDFLMTALGRPNRDQIVSVRPLELTPLEAIHLSNGETLANTLRNGATNLQKQNWQSPKELIVWLYQFALSREPTPEELVVLVEATGDSLSVEKIEDLLWAVVMLPEYQLVR
ncbi:MAG: DUF1549 domain-containing protein [Planctomycetaceae bacterium]